MTSLKQVSIALALASATMAAPALAQCGTPAGCNDQPTVGDNINANSNNNNIRVEGSTNMLSNSNTIGIHNANSNTIGVGVRTGDTIIGDTNISVAPRLTATGGEGGVGYGGTAYGGQSNANVGDVRASVGNVAGGAGGSLNLATGAIAPVANATGGSLTNSGNSSSTSNGGNASATTGPSTSSASLSNVGNANAAGGSVNGLQTGNQSVNINNPRNAFSPSVNAYASGDCGQGVSLNLGLPGFGTGTGFSGQSKSCHERRNAMSLVTLGVESGNADLAATGFARLADEKRGDKRLKDAFEARGAYVGMFTPKTVQPQAVQTFTVPAVPAPQ